MRPSEHVREPGRWDTSEVDQQASPEPKRLGVRCTGCGFGYRVMALPFHPRVAKSDCPKCGYTNEVITRDEAAASLEEMLEYNHGAAQQRKHPKAFSKPAQDRRDLKIVQTKLGRAALIG